MDPVQFVLEQTERRRKTLEPNKCQNCGGELLEINGDIVCNHCGTNYGKKPKSAQEEYIEALMASYILKATTNKSNNKQNKHLYQARDEFYNGHYADCKVHLNRALEIDPGNADANLMKRLLTKGQNGRYINPPSYKYVSAINSWLKDEYYKETIYIDSLFLSYLPSIFISLREVNNLIKLIEASRVEDKDEFLEILNKRKRRKIIAKCILWPLIILLLTLTINDCSKKAAEKATVKIVYQAYSNGGIYIPSKKKYYSSYTYTVSQGDKTVATAVPFDGYKFLRWSDNCTYISREDTVYSSSSVTAYFVKDNSTTKQESETASNSALINNLNSGLQREIQVESIGAPIVITPNFKYEFSNWDNNYDNAFNINPNIILNIEVDDLFENLFFDWENHKEWKFILLFFLSLQNP